LAGKGDCLSRVETVNTNLWRPLEFHCHTKIRGEADSRSPETVDALWMGWSWRGLEFWDYPLHETNP
jgi:hypothetical protein